MAAEASAVARPKAVFTTAFITGRGEDFVELDGVRMLSRVMPAEHERACTARFPYVATCGTEAEEWSRGIADPL